jgi:branched-chain amino acid transport system substrate-binding protein
MKQKQKFLTVITLLATLLMLPFGMAQAQEDCNFAEETIRLGGIAPLSAPGAVAGGIQMSWAFKAATADINNDCGVEIDGVNYRVEVIVVDSEGLPDRAQAVTERLIFDNKVHGLVGVYHSAVGLATYPIAQANKIPTVYSEPWNDNVTANGIIEYDGRAPRFETDGIDYIFRIAPASFMVSSVAIDWLLNQGVEDVVIVAENTDYGIPAAATDQELLEAGGVNVEVLYIEMGTDDFIPILSRIQARPNPPDAIKSQITGETSLNFTQQMAELGIAPNEDTICITNQFAFQSEQYWRSVPDGNWCAFQRVGIIPTLFNDTTQRLADDFRKFFKEDIASYALASYDSVIIMADAMERAGTFTDADAIVAAIEATDLDGAQGRYYFEYGSNNPVPLDEGVPAFMWHQWPDPIVTMMQYWEVGQTGPEAAVIWPPAYQTNGTSYVVPGTTPDG